MAKDGGTRLYCPKCKCVQVMSVINPRDSEANFQNIFYEDFPHGAGNFESDPELWVFHRVRACTYCSVEFHYWEIDEFVLRDFRNLKEKREKINELLTELKDLLSQMNSSMKRLQKLEKALE